MLMRFKYSFQFERYTLNIVDYFPDNHPSNHILKLIYIKGVTK